MHLRGLFTRCALLALVLAVSPGLKAADTSFDSLAFVPDSTDGPAVRLPDHPALSWTRVTFRPQQTNDFPESIRPARVLTSPAGQVSGLAVEGTNLWVASRETRRIYRLDTRTAALVESFDTPGERPAGLCWDGQRLWHADGLSRSLCALDGAGQVLQRFPLSFEPATVCHAAGELWISDGNKATFHRLDPESGRELGMERAPDDRLTGLTGVGRYFWCSRGDEILCFDPERSLPVCGFSTVLTGFEGGTVAGLTAEGKTFWYATSAGNRIVQIPVPRHGQWVGGNGRLRQTGFEMVYRNVSGQPVESFTVLQHVPFLEMPGQRYLTLQIQPTPRALFRDDLGNVVALLDFGSLTNNQRVRCQIAAAMWVADRRMVIDPDQMTASLSPEQNAYTRSFHSIAGEDSAEVKSFLEQAVRGETNVYWRVRKAHDALCQAIYYREPADESVPGILRQGYGVCRNYSAAMESFGRLLGVPVLNAWAPRHETCFLMLPGLSPAVMEVTANDSGPDPATTWRRSRWLLGTSANEITTGVRGYAMHSQLLLGDVPYSYRWHYWIPTGLRGIRHEGWWTVTDPGTGKIRRL